MATLPLLSGREVTSAFVWLGWTVARRNDSHVVFTKAGEVATLSVPDHGEVARGTLRSLMRAANLSVDEYLAAV